MNGAQFRQAQAQVLADRVPCWSCNNLFDKKQEMRSTIVTLVVGKVVTAENLTSSLLHRTDINPDNFDSMVERPNLYEERAVLVCSDCYEEGNKDWKENHYNDKGYWVAEKTPADLYLD